jgi:hypothetical protein
MIILVSDNYKHFISSSKIDDARISNVFVINLTNSEEVTKKCSTFKYQCFNISNIISPVVILNNIINASTSKFIFISTGTVTLYKNAISDLLKYFSIHEKIAFVYSDYDYMNNGKLEPRFQHPYDSRLIYNNILPALVGIYNRELLIASGGFKESNQETFVNLASQGLFFHHAASLFMDKQ